MTQVFDFAPSITGSPPFQFQPTLDDSVYNATVGWLLYGQRWYLSVFTLDGDRVFSIPLVGSPTGTNNASLVWKDGRVTATTIQPHEFTVGAQVSVQILGATPAALSGTFLAYVIDTQTFSYPVAQDPGTTTSPGIVRHDVNLAGGYFDSTIVYREANGQIEVSP